MPWTRRGFKGGKIFARVDERGALVLKDGLVDIKYRAEDKRLYTARASAVTELRGEAPTLYPDVEGEAAVPKKDGDSAATGATRRSPAAVRTGSATPLSGRPGAIVIYTDGACIGNPGPAGVGVVLLYQGVRKELSEYLGHGTNNIAELTAVLRGLQSVKDATLPVDVFLDSSYSIGVLTKNWKPKVNQELIAQIRGEMRRFRDLAFIKVPGHAGVPENERADQLAGQAVELRGPMAPGTT